MRFKVGNKVKFVKKLENHSDKVRLGGIYKIKYVDSFTSYMPYKTENGEWFGEKELELANYTYEDLKKSPIGTKITFENKTALIKLHHNYYRECSEMGYYRNEKDLKNLKDNLSGTLGKIIKIEEPEYKTVYEYKPEILDEVEKRYLRGVVRPFRNNVEIIRRMYSRTKNKDYIQIRYKNDTPTNLPYFEKDTMYRGMELDKIYTLEELGL